MNQSDRVGRRAVDEARECTASNGQLVAEYRRKYGTGSTYEMLILTAERDRSKTWPEFGL